MSSWADRLAALFQAHRSRLETLVARRTGDRDSAPDLVQDAFTRLLSAGSSGSAEADTRMLYVIARNAAIDHGRSQRRRGSLLASLVPEQFTLTDVPVDQALEARQAMAELVTALKTLPERTQDVFVLRRVHGLSYADIAQTMGISVSTVEKDLLRALRHCQTRLRSHWPV